MQKGIVWFKDTRFTGGGVLIKYQCKLFFVDIRARTIKDFDKVL